MRTMCAVRRMPKQTQVILSAILVRLLEAASLDNLFVINEANDP